MSKANDYKLCVSAITGTVYLSKVSKKDPNLMLDDRREVSKQEYISALVQWVESQLDGSDVLNITAGGKPFIEIKILNTGGKAPVEKILDLPQSPNSSEVITMEGGENV